MHFLLAIWTSVGHLILFLPWGWIHFRFAQSAMAPFGQIWYYKPWTFQNFILGDLFQPDDNKRMIFKKILYMFSGPILAGVGMAIGSVE